MNSSLMAGSDSTSARHCQYPELRMLGLRHPTSQPSSSERRLLRRHYSAFLAIPARKPWRPRRSTPRRPGLRPRPRPSRVRNADSLPDQRPSAQPHAPHQVLRIDPDRRPALPRPHSYGECTDARVRSRCSRSVAAGPGVVCGQLLNWVNMVEFSPFGTPDDGFGSRPDPVVAQRFTEYRRRGRSGRAPPRGPPLPRPPFAPPRRAPPRGRSRSGRPAGAGNRGSVR